MLTDGKDFVIYEGSTRLCPPNALLRVSCFHNQLHVFFSVFTGEYNDGQIHGRGVYHFQNGDKVSHGPVRVCCSSLSSTFCHLCTYLLCLLFDISLLHVNVAVLLTQTYICIYLIFKCFLSMTENGKRTCAMERLDTSQGCK
jgi:hypothetical protein